MPTAVEDVVQAAATGVLRALDARRAGQKGAQEIIDAAGLVRSGFFVSVVIRAGGFPPGPIWEQSALNPQPLPPGE